MRVKLYTKALAIELLDDYIPKGTNYSPDDRRALKAERRKLKEALSQMGLSETINLNSTIWRVRHESYFDRNYGDMSFVTDKVEEILKTHNKLFGWNLLA